MDNSNVAKCENCAYWHRQGNSVEGICVIMDAYMDDDELCLSWKPRQIKPRFKRNNGFNKKTR
jgi:hypothetical protein